MTMKLSVVKCAQKSYAKSKDIMLKYHFSKSESHQ